MSATVGRTFDREAQRLDALRQANGTRRANAELKRRIYALPKEQGRAAAAEVVRQPSRSAQAMGLDQLLLSVRGLGHRKIPPLVREAGVSPHITLGLLTPAQRDRIAARLVGGEPFAQDRHGERPSRDPWAAKLLADVDRLSRENDELRTELVAMSRLHRENDALRAALVRASEAA